jgi:hypothetical protein
MKKSQGRCHLATDSVRASVRAVLYGGAIASLCASGSALAADPEPAQQAETELEEVIVTGTLIRSPNQTASSPIVSAGIDDLERSVTFR